MRSKSCSTFFRDLFAIPQPVKVTPSAVSIVPDDAPGHPGGQAPPVRVEQGEAPDVIRYGDLAQAKEENNNPLPATKVEVQAPSVVSERSTVDEYRHNPDQRLIIELDITSIRLQHFLDLMDLATLRHLADSSSLKVTLGWVKSMLPLADRFDSDIAHAMLAQRLHAIASTLPWDVLYLASEREDVGLAKFAIRQIAPKHLFDIDKIRANAAPTVDQTLRQALAKLQPLWHLEMMTLLFTDEVRGVSNNAVRPELGTPLFVSRLDTDMSSIADRFNPARFKTL